MPLFFFDIRDGEYFPDETGTDLADLEAARLHAVLRSADLLKADPSRFWDGEEWQLEVRDAGRKLLFVLTFLATNSPKTPRRKLSRPARAWPLS